MDRGLGGRDGTSTTFEPASGAKADHPAPQAANSDNRGVGVASARALLSHGVRDPIAYAQILRANLGAQSEIVALLHQSIGNSAVGEILNAAAAATDGDASTASASSPLPHQEAIQRSFGHHDVSHIRSQTGGGASQTAQALGATAFAVGDTVAFDSSPDLRTAAHEAAHVVQQRDGVQLLGGIDGGAGDPHEQHADAVADAVVAGRSAEGLLDKKQGGSPATALQRSPAQRGGALQTPTAVPANAAIRVVAFDAHNKPIKSWEAVGHWEGDLPQDYIAELRNGKWVWNDNHAHPPMFRLNAKEDGTGGEAVEAWAARLGAHKVEVLAVEAEKASTLKQQTTEADQPDTHAPGHAENARDAGNGGSETVRPGAKGHGEHEHDHDATAGGAHTNSESRSGGAGTQSGSGHGATTSGGGTSTSTGTLSTPSGTTDAKRNDELKGVDALEKRLNDESDSEGAPTQGNAKGGGEGGEGYKGGAQQGGHKGKDTSTRGSGPGGDKAKDGGKETGNGGAHDNEGSEAGDSDGVKHGSEDGRFGGEGKDGDDGVRGAGAWFGGLAAVPEVLKGAVELGLMYDQADISGAATDFFKAAAKEAAGKGASNIGLATAAAEFRELLAVESRVVAARKLESTMQKLKASKKFTALTKAQKAQVERILYWKFQRAFFRKVGRAAEIENGVIKRALAGAKGADRTALQARQEFTAVGEKAAKVEPVAGRLPQNHALGGELVPDAMIPKRFRGKGFKFTESGFPDFTPFAMTLPNGQKSVRIVYQGSREADYAAADLAAGFKDTHPPDWTWHHNHEVGVMELVPRDLHRISHTGGVALHKEQKGLLKYDPSGIDDD